MIDTRYEKAGRKTLMLGLYLHLRKVSNEDGIQLPFTYIGEGKMEYLDGSRKPNGAYLFWIPMSQTAPEDICFDFKLPDGGGTV